MKLSKAQIVKLEENLKLNGQVNALSLFPDAPKTELHKNVAGVVTKGRFSNIFEATGFAYGIPVVGKEVAIGEHELHLGEFATTRDHTKVNGDVMPKGTLRTFAYTA